MASSIVSSVLKRQPVVFVPHGGGPMPVLGDPGHSELIAFLKSFRKNILPRYSKVKPSAILLVTAHWEESTVTITSAPNPELFYDYYGFPKEAYSLQYPAPGHPELARDIKDLLASKGIVSELNGKRGYDHGVFIPLKLMFPEANIPVVQMSLYKDLDPVKHFQLGQALSSLREIEGKNILIIGSGMSFHSFKYFFGDIDRANEVSVPFHQYLAEAVVATKTAAERKKKLSQWTSAPYAKEVHPREEHLLPLHVIAGAGLDDPCEEVFPGSVMNIRTSGFLFGVPEV